MPIRYNGFVIPDNFLVAAKLVISTTPEIVNLNHFYIGRITSYNGGINLIIRYENIDVGTASVSNIGEFNTTFPIIGLNNFHNLTGHVTIGSFESMSTQLGDYEFNLEGGRLDVDVIQYASLTATSVTVINSDGSSSTVNGDFTLEAGENININTIPAEDSTSITISRKINNFVERNNCIRSLSGITPDPLTGNIDIKSYTDCLQITPGQASLQIRETCCEPCCGCEELNSIQQYIQMLVTENNNIRLYQQKLEQQLLQLQTSMSITGV